MKPRGLNTHVPLNRLILRRAGSDVAGEQMPGKALRNSNLKVDRHREEALELTEDHPTFRRASRL